MDVKDLVNIGAEAGRKSRENADSYEWYRAFVRAVVNAIGTVSVVTDSSLPGDLRKAAARVCALFADDGQGNPCIDVTLDEEILDGVEFRRSAVTRRRFADLSLPLPSDDADDAVRALRHMLAAGEGRGESTV